MLELRSLLFENTNNHLGVTFNCMLKKLTFEPPLARAIQIDRLRRQQQLASGLLIESRVSL